MSAGQQPSPAEQASTGMATPRRLTQMARMAVRRRNTLFRPLRSSSLDARPGGTFSQVRRNPGRRLVLAPVIQFDHPQPAKDSTTARCRRPAI